MKEEQFTETDSLRLINEMIRNAKSNFTDNGYGWLLWGTMIFISSLGTYFLIEYDHEKTFLFWNIFGGVSVLILAYDFFKPSRSRARSYVSDILRYVDIGFAVCLFIIIFSMNVAVHPNAGFGYLLMLYGFLMLIQAGAIKFKPLFIGAFVNWLGALAVFLNTEFKYDMLITAAAVFIGYIIPGLILRAQSKKNQASEINDPSDTRNGI